MSQLMEPLGENASMEEIRCYAQAMRDYAFSVSLASTSKLLEASLNNQAPKQDTRKPELPPFDKKNMKCRRGRGMYGACDKSSDDESH